MKNLLGILVIVVSLYSCKKDKNRTSGVCYCEFVKGDDQEFDLRHLTRQEQNDACNTHDNNAANFGGRCELE